MPGAVYYHAPNDDTAATVTIPAYNSFDSAREISSIQFSYDDTPTGGLLTVESPSGTVIWRHHITAAGIGPIDFPTPLPGAEGQAMIVTLAAGGSGIAGKLTVIARE